MRTDQKSRRFALGLLLATLLLVGCGDEIGDSCSTNVDCSPLGDRICLLSQLEGYCSVVGCGIDSCPEEAACIRIFPTSFLSTPCAPLTEDAVDPGSDPVDPTIKLTATNHCTPDETCLSSGFCALRTLEKRYCMKTCEQDSDCRDGYECRRTGTRGAEAIPNPDTVGVQQVQFCAEAI